MCYEQIASCEKKARYRTRHFALQIALDYRRRGQALRVYACHFCGGFHLTHTERKVA